MQYCSSNINNNILTKYETNGTNEGKLFNEKNPKHYQTNKPTIHPNQAVKACLKTTAAPIWEYYHQISAIKQFKFFLWWI